MELPRLEPLFQKYQDQGLEIIAVDGMRDSKRAQEFISKNKLSYTFLENGAEDAEFVNGTFQVTSYPTSFLIDEDGKILYMHLGFHEGDDAKLEKEIKKLLAM